jgi:alkanesulfonate monooxygenase SsuD/methylene tetrahydromethanopterin reductase-like flavin-dependent oxidoreductase (luciferase family)
LGFEFGTFTERFDKLGEALQIILPMIKGDRPTFSGKYYRTESAMAEPRFRDHIPLMIGGSGERKTIPLAARYFDHLNVIAPFDQLPGKVDVIRQRCEDIGRDPATLETSVLVTAVIGGDAADLPEGLGGVAGSPEQVAEQVKANVLDAGIDGVIINLPTAAQGYRPGVLTALADVLKPLVGR